MRVKLSYTVELGDVPFRLREIVKECGQGLLAQGDALENASYEQEIGESFLEQIDSVRRVLALIDDRLNDCYSGAVGYSQLLLQQRSQPDAQQHPQGPEFSHDAPPVDEEQMRALQQQLQELRQDDFGGLGGGEEG